jgi:hypothetical protein
VSVLPMTWQEAVQVEVGSSTMVRKVQQGMKVVRCHLLLWERQHQGQQRGLK